MFGASSRETNWHERRSTSARKFPGSNRTFAHRLLGRNEASDRILSSVDSRTKNATRKGNLTPSLTKERTRRPFHEIRQIDGARALRCISLKEEEDKGYNIVQLITPII